MNQLRTNELRSMLPELVIDYDYFVDMMQQVRDSYSSQTLFGIQPVDIFLPTDSRIREICDEAERNNCGFFMEMNKPQTLCASIFVRPGRMVMINYDLFFKDHEKGG